jgi:hypothetical protein
VFADANPAARERHVTKDVHGNGDDDEVHNDGEDEAESEQGTRR